jgi:predicted methyltransferase
MRLVRRDLRVRLSWLCALAGALVCAGTLAAAHLKAERPRPRAGSPLFDPAAATEQLEGPERDRWQQPERIVRTLRLEPGMTVADVGAGSGYLLPHLSRAVGHSGMVFAEEIQADFLARLQRRADDLGNVRVVHGTSVDPCLPPESVDCFVMLTVYHEVGQPVILLRSLRKAARPGARLAVIDFDAARKGDPPAPKDHHVPERDVIVEARAAGWELVERHEFLPSQFFLVFR